MREAPLLVLVVDDEEAVVFVLQSWFERRLPPSEFEYEFCGVRTFDSALALLQTRSNDIALAILDQDLKSGESKTGNQLALCCEELGVPYGRYVANPATIEGHEGRFVLIKACSEVWHVVDEAKKALQEEAA